MTYLNLMFNIHKGPSFMGTRNQLGSNMIMVEVVGILNISRYLGRWFWVGYWF
jgi:lipocalin